MTDYDLQPGSAALTSAGPITFGPDGILFLADNATGSIVAVDVADHAEPATTSDGFALRDVDARIAALLGSATGDIRIRDMAVHPVTSAVYLSVQRGSGDDARAVLVRIDAAGVTEVPLDDVPLSRFALEDAPAADDERQDVLLPVDDEGEVFSREGRSVRVLRAPIRTSTVTDLVYVDGDLLVSGLSNEEFSSKLRRVPFPFGSTAEETSLEIFHVSHGRWETASPIRTFVAADEGRSILAGYTCTPVVHFSVDDLVPGTKAIGRTVADLGNMNQPLGMVTFVQDGEEHLLVSNTSHGLLKIAHSDIDAQAPLTEPFEPVGVPRQDEGLLGIRQLANLDPAHVLALQADEDGHLHLRSLETASL